MHGGKIKIKIKNILNIHDLNSERISYLKMAEVRFILKLKVEPTNLKINNVNPS